MNVDKIIKDALEIAVYHKSQQLVKELNSLKDKKIKTLSVNSRQEIQEWLQDSKEYGFIEGNPLINRAQKLFKEIIKEDDEKIL